MIDDVRAMRRATLTLGGMLGFSGLISISFHFLRRPAPYLVPLWLVLLSLTAIGTAVVLWPRTSRFAPLVFAGEFALALCGIWSNQERMAMVGQRFEPLFGYRILAIGIALLAPPNLWIGWGGIAASAAVALVQWNHWVGVDAPIQEPFGTMAFIGIAGFLYGYRLRSRNVERELVRLTTERAALNRFAHRMVCACHLARTPLQTIENITSVLRNRLPENQDSIERVTRAVERLSQITELLAHYDRHIESLSPSERIDLASLEREILTELGIEDRSVERQPPVAPIRSAE